MRRALFLLGSLLCAGSLWACGAAPGSAERCRVEGPAQAQAQAHAGAEEEPEEAEAAEEEPGLLISVRTPEEPEEGLRITAVARGATASARWSAEAGFEELTAEDAEGPIEVAVEGGRAQLSRAPSPPLTLRYRLPPPAAPSEHLGLSTRRIFFDGRALLLPEIAPEGETTEEETEIRVEVRARAVEGEEVSSTLGAGAVQSLRARPGALRGVLFGVGHIDEARFLAREGRDRVASVGGRAFDLRWVAAEIVLLRSRIDGFFAALDPSQHEVLIVTRPPAGRMPPFAAARSGRGLRLFAREDASWGAEARLPVAQVLARRWLAGLFVGPEGREEAWASLGLSRWVAQRSLAGMGTLTSRELAADLTMLEGALALASSQGASSQAASSRASSSEAPIEGIEAMARGALYAAGLDARLRARSALPRSLQHLLLPLMSEAEERGGPIRREDFTAALRAALGEAEVARFASQALGAEPIELPPGAFGPCLRPGRAVHRRFALGFDAPPLHAEAVEVRGVIEGGPAHRAGLRDGMRLRDLRYAPGDPNVELSATLVAEPERAIRFRPSDLEVRGRAWTRAPGVDEERCF